MAENAYISAGHGFVGPDGRTYEVISVQSATQAGASCGIFPTYAQRVSLNERLDQRLTEYEDIANRTALTAGGANVFQWGTTGATLDQPLTGMAVQKGASDVTAGRLLTTGAFGLLEVGRRTSTEISQTYEPAGSLAGENTKFCRVYNSVSGAWLPWSIQYGSHNVLSAVALSGGKPTGGLIFRGSGPNGSFVQLADGTLLCQHEITLSYATVNILSANWTFPAAFTAPPYTALTLSNQGGDYTGGVTLRDIGAACVFPTGNTTGIFNLYRASGATGTWATNASALKVKVTAQGKWSA